MFPDWQATPVLPDRTGAPITGATLPTVTCVLSLRAASPSETSSVAVYTPLSSHVTVGEATVASLSTQSAPASLPTSPVTDQAYVERAAVGVTACAPDKADRTALVAADVGARARHRRSVGGRQDDAVADLEDMSDRPGWCSGCCGPARRSDFRPAGRRSHQSRGVLQSLTGAGGVADAGGGAAEAAGAAAGAAGLPLDLVVVELDVEVCRRCRCRSGR